MAQTGDPTGTGKGGESVYGYAFYSFFYSSTTNICCKLLFLQYIKFCTL